ncbi:MAG: hypothetical protein H6Q42_3711, partial [Deltaproteobacteria bacterium]|nr:hypothetical protein [Deltaproteobacteria bacterium]
EPSPAEDACTPARPTGRKRIKETEKAIRRYNEERTLKTRVSDETFSAVGDALGEKGGVELTTAIGYYGMACRILETLHVDLE